jgi:hypothetical protein
LAVDGVDHIESDRIGLIAIIGSVALIGSIILPIFWPIVILPILALIRVDLLTAFLLGRHFAHRFCQHAGVMFGMLRKVFGGNPIIRSLRVPCQHLIFFDDLLGRATHFAFGARAVENTIDDIA